MNLRNIQIVPNPAVLDFNAEEYWRDKPIKKWVVYLERQRGGRVVERDTKIVSASTYAMAKQTAAANSLIDPTHVGLCRLATPVDLGATMMVVEGGAA